MSSYPQAFPCPPVGLGGVELEVRMDPNQWVREGVRDAILMQNNYCAKPNTKPDANSSSRVLKVLRAWAPRITLDYDLVTSIAIQPLTRPVTCIMGLSIFAAMIWLKLVSTTSVSFSITPFTKMTNGEKCFHWS